MNKIYTYKYSCLFIFIILIFNKNHSMGEDNSNNSITLSQEEFLDQYNSREGLEELIKKGFFYVKHGVFGGRLKFFDKDTNIHFYEKKPDKVEGSADIKKINQYLSLKDFLNIKEQNNTLIPNILNPLVEAIIEKKDIYHNLENTESEEAARSILKQAILSENLIFDKIFYKSFIENKENKEYKISNFRLNNINNGTNIIQRLISNFIYKEYEATYILDKYSNKEENTDFLFLAWFAQIKNQSSEILEKIFDHILKNSGEVKNLFFETSKKNKTFIEYIKKYCENNNLNINITEKEKVENSKLFVKISKLLKQ